MDQKEILNKMHDFSENVLHFSFIHIDKLAEAMRSQLIKTDKSGKNYSNENLAFVGDSILKLVLADDLYTDNKENNRGKTKGDLTEDKSVLEKNAVLHRIMKEEEWIKYSYNDIHFYDEKHKTDKVVCKKHDPYIETIVAAMYYDSGFEKTKDWILTYLKPLLEKYKN